MKNIYIYEKYTPQIFNEPYMATLTMLQKLVGPYCFYSANHADSPTLDEKSIAHQKFE